MTLTLVPKKPKPTTTKEATKEANMDTTKDILTPDTSITLEELAHNLGYSNEWIIKNVINAMGTIGMIHANEYLENGIAFLINTGEDYDVEIIVHKVPLDRKSSPRLDS